MGAASSFEGGGWPGGYEDQGYLPPNEFITKLKGNAKESFLGNAFSRMSHGSGVEPDKHGYMDRIHDLRAKQRESMSE